MMSLRLALFSIVLATAMAAEGALLEHKKLQLLHQVLSARFLVGVASDDCKIMEECSLCDAATRASVAECGKTGRVERWQCEIGEEEGEEEAAAGAGTSILYRSCDRTAADDEFLMVRLQVVCVVIGAAAFVSARKQKVLSANLFDQRKLGLEAKRRRRDSSAIDPTQDVEMTQLQMESVPLTDDVEVV